MSFPELLSYIMDSHGTSNSALGKAIGVSDVAVLRWRRGDTSPKLDDVIKIADYFGVSLNELTGSDDEADAGLVPIVGRIQAGYPIESYTGRYGTIRLPSDRSMSSDLFVLEVVGDSMMPIVMEGDIIICEKVESSSANNKICVVTIDEESTLKKLKIDSKGITLIPLNPLYKEMHYSKQECKEKNFRIDGKVIESIRKFD